MRPELARLLDTVRKLAAAASPRDDVLGAICHLLWEEVEHYDWVGIYLADPETRMLTLGQFAGEPTEHVRIPYGRGICGQAAETMETFVVQDVAAEDNYLACSPYVKSEIVLPIIDDRGNLLGELDIDSHASAPFTDDDREFLAGVCGVLAGLL